MQFCTRWLPCAALFLISQLIFCGCNNNKKITYSKVPKGQYQKPLQQESHIPMMGSMKGAEPSQIKPAVRVQPETGLGKIIVKRKLPVTYTLPENWKDIPGNGMRIVSFSRDHNGEKLEGYLLGLKGQGGGLGPNMNRWRGQLGLQALTPEQAVSAFKKGESGMGEFLWCTLFSQKEPVRGFAVAVFSGQETSYFLKFQGSASAIKSGETEFLALCRSFSLAH